MNPSDALGQIWTRGATPSLVGGIWAAPSLLSLERSWGRSPRCRPSNTPKFIFWSCFSFKQIFASKIFFQRYVTALLLWKFSNGRFLEKWAQNLSLFGHGLTTSHTHDSYKLCETLCGATTHLRTLCGTPLLCSRSPVLGAAATRDEESCVKLLAPLPSDRRPNPPDHFGMLIEAQKLRFPFRGFLLDTGRSLTRTCSILCFVLYLIYEAGVVNLCIVSRLPSIYL